MKNSNQNNPIGFNRENESTPDYYWYSTCTYNNIEVSYIIKNK